MILHIFSADFKPLPIYFVTCAAKHMQEPVAREEGFSDLSQLLFVLEGEGVLYCGGKEYPIKQGNAFCVAPEVSHSYHGIDGLVTAWITWRGSGYEDILQYLGQSGFAFYHDVDCKKYARQIEMIEQEYFGKRREGTLSALLYSMLISFFEEQNRTVFSDLDRVICYMEEHFSDRITIDELARVHRSSKSTFCEKFKRAYGCTAFEKLIEIRLINAESMLKMNPNEKILTVAERCGFVDVSYFCKAYKKKFGVTPANHRVVR